MKKLIAWVYLIYAPIVLVWSFAWFIATDTDDAVYDVMVDLVIFLATFAAVSVGVAIISFLLVESIVVIKK